MSLYGGAVAASALLAACLMAALTPKDRRYTVPLTAALSIALGLIGARLVFWLCSWTLYMDQLRDFSTLFRVRDGGLAMTGALLGVALGTWLAQKIIHDPRWSFAQAADTLAPAMALFIACERCHEWPLLKQNYGLDVAGIPFFTVQGDYSPVIDLARISSLIALMILAALLLVHVSRDGDRALLFLLLYGVTQTMLESLRQDRHLLWGFVHAQQLFAFLMAVAAVMVFSLRRGRPLKALGVSFITAGLVIFLEFALDGRVPVPFEFMKVHFKLSWYVLLFVVLAAYAAYGVRLMGSDRKEGKAS